MTNEDEPELKLGFCLLCGEYRKIYQERGICRSCDRRFFIHEKRKRVSNNTLKNSRLNVSRAIILRLV